jgi:hypothetical protein
MIPRTPTKGKFCIIAEGPVNVGLGALQMSVAKMKGKRATATLLLAFGQLQNSVAEARGCFLPDRSGPPAILDELSPSRTSTAQGHKRGSGRSLP